MPEHQITLSDEEHRILEEIRKKQGLATIEEAATWLAKTSLRLNTKKFNGRGRALYLTYQETTK